jgi:cytosine/adenosine deaminase-related metal-dependent hydrolase
MSGAAVPGPARARAAVAVNAHTHLYSGLAPLGMPAPSPPPEDFVRILERVWWRLDRALDEDALRAAVRYHVADALLHGTTTLIDHHESPNLIEGVLDVIADEVEALGARALLCYGATERNRGRDEAEDGLAECRRFFLAAPRPHVRGVVGLHASFTVSDETVREAAALCAELGTVLHVHVAEDAADVADARRRGYEGPLERLLALGALPPGSILAHGVHLSEAQVRAADAAGLWLVQNPRSNEGNRVGYGGALWASARVALGTDGWASDMAAEEAALVRLAAAHADRGGPGVAVRRRAASAALAAERFGADALARDVVELEAPVPGEPTRAWRVEVDGAVVVEHGRLTRADLGELRAHAREQALRLWRRMEEVE